MNIEYISGINFFISIVRANLNVNLKNKTNILTQIECTVIIN